MAAEHHDDHGSTPANWTGALIIMVASVIATLGVVIAQPIVFVLGMLGVIGGAVAWKILLGMQPKNEDIGV